MDDKQYGAFALNALTLDQFRQGRNIRYVPGTFVVKKVVMLGEDGFASLAGDLSAEYVFLEESRDLMAADPGGLFHCVLARTEMGKEGILFALQGIDRYAAHVKNVYALKIDPTAPVEQIPQSRIPCIQTKAIFYHKPRGVEDITGIDYVRNTAERKEQFAVEKTIVLPDDQFSMYQSGGFLQDRIFLFDNLDKMWFDPAARTWHCLLVKGETSQDGILVEAEGYSYARYAAYVPDCALLRLRDIPIQHEPPAKPPHGRTPGRRSRGQER